MQSTHVEGFSKATENRKKMTKKEKINIFSSGRKPNESTRFRIYTGAMVTIKCSFIAEMNL